MKRCGFKLNFVIDFDDSVSSEIGIFQSDSIAVFIKLENPFKVFRRAFKLLNLNGGGGGGGSKN